MSEKIVSTRKKLKRSKGIQSDSRLGGLFLIKQSGKFFSERCCIIRGVNEIRVNTMRGIRTTEFQEHG